MTNPLPARALDRGLAGCLVVEHDSIEHFDHVTHVHDQSGLFENLARHPRFERFTDFQSAARQAPMAGERLESAPDENDAAECRPEIRNAFDAAVRINEN